MPMKSLCKAGLFTRANQGVYALNHSRSDLSFCRTPAIAFAHSPGSSDSTTNDLPDGTVHSASPNPEFPLTRMGRPADNASNAVKPKPSVLEGMMQRSTSQNNSFNLSLLCTNFLTFFGCSVHYLNPLATVILSDNLGLLTKLCTMTQHKVNDKVSWWETQPFKRITEACKFLGFQDGNIADCGTRRVTSTPECLANRMASCLLMVDKPPIDELHSLPRRVTFKAVPDGTDLFHFVHGHQTWSEYLVHMERDGAWGDHVILCATANYFETCIRVVSSLSHRNDNLLLSVNKTPSAKDNDLPKMKHGVGNTGRRLWIKTVNDD
ncbi:hypothetical protein pdam_00019306, partial [Pocillopora damicornis]